MLLLGCAACGAAACAGPSRSDGGDAVDAVNPGTDAFDDGTPADTTMADAGDEVADDVQQPDVQVRDASCDGIDIGAVTDFPEGTLQLIRVPGTRVVLGRDAAGFWCFNGICAHFEGNLLPQADRTALCDNTNGGRALHLSLYDENGVNLRAAAGMPARTDYNRNNFTVRICNGRVLIDRSNAAIVPRGTRTPVT